MPSNQNNCNNCGCTPNPLDSANWESESTVGRSSITASTTATGSPSGGPECKIGFKDKSVCKHFDDGSYDAAANLDSQSNCKAEDLIWGIEEPSEGATIDSHGTVTFGSVSAVVTVSVMCGTVSDTMSLRYAKIEWLESEVILEWYEQPSGVYHASSNVDTSNGGAMPDYWSLEVIDEEETSATLAAASQDSETAETDATINSASGEVTFGSKGQMFSITGTIGGCLLCAAVMKGTVIKLAIQRDGKDETGKTTKAFAGETVTLKGVVTPKKYSGTDWRWTVPEITVKDFVVSNNNTNGKRENYTPADWKINPITVHWVDGEPTGLDKTVSVSATVNGKLITAETTVSVKRPKAVANGFNRNPRIEWSNKDSAWVATTDVEFTREKISEKGDAQWIQLGTFVKSWETVTGTNVSIPLPPPDGTVPGLDTCAYPYSADFITQDFPQSALLAGYLWKGFDFNMKMWLMWKSPKPGIWVPLVSAKWWFRGTMQSTGQPNSQQQKPVWKNLGPGKDNPDFGVTDFKEDTSYPEWSKCLNPNEG